MIRRITTDQCGNPRIIFSSGLTMDVVKTDKGNYAFVTNKGDAAIVSDNDFMYLIELLSKLKEN